jgi:hypothetical protein
MNERDTRTRVDALLERIPQNRTVPLLEIGVDERFVSGNEPDRDADDAPDGTEKEGKRLSFIRQK